MLGSRAFILSLESKKIADYQNQKIKIKIADYVATCSQIIGPSDTLLYTHIKGMIYFHTCSLGHQLSITPGMLFNEAD